MRACGCGDGIGIQMRRSGRGACRAEYNRVNEPNACARHVWGTDWIDVLIARVVHEWAAQTVIALWCHALALSPRVVASAECFLKVQSPLYANQPLIDRRSRPVGCAERSVNLTVPSEINWTKNGAVFVKKACKIVSIAKYSTTVRQNQYTTGAVDTIRCSIRFAFQWVPF